MADFNNIVGGLNITTQIPLDVKTVSLTESALASLGTGNNKAFTYYDGLKVFCLDTRKTYEWRERQIDDGHGLLFLDFTYPNNTICFGVTYSNKIFNFFEINYIYSENLKEITSPDNSVNITETSTEIQLSVDAPTGAETKIINGLETIVTGNGTTLNPYMINGKLYQAGSNISITGLGTSISPYIISVNTSSGNIGWLPGDTKEVVCTKEYLQLNFNNTGLGINERVGWAIMNGTTHTYNGQTITVPDDTGLVVVGYGNQLDYDDPETTGGEEKHTLIKAEIPSTKIDIPVIGGSSGLGFDINSTDKGGELSFNTDGGGGAHNNMQPYVVRLRIMKL